MNQAQILDFKDVTREDVERLAQLIATAVVKVEGFKIQGQGFALTYLHGQLQAEDLIVDYRSIRLDLMVTSTGGWTDPIGQLRQWLLDQLSGLASWIVNSLWGLVKPVLDGISGAVSGVASSLSGLWDWLTSQLQGLRDAFNQVVVQPILNALSWINENLPRLAGVIGSAIDSITKLLAELPGKVAEAAKGIADWLWNTLKDAVSRFMDLINQAGQALAKLPELISQAASGVIDWLKQAVSNAIQGITDVISSVIDSVKAAVGEIGKYFEPLVTWLSKLGDLLKNAFDLISDFITGLPEKAKGFFDWLGEKVKEVADFIAHFPERITQLVSDVTGWIWEHLPDWVKTFLTEAPKALMQVGSAVTGFINAILKFPEWF
ncbi:MAG: phage tail protein, partial [Candidatus Hecatellaceae archaeon]